MRLGRQVIAGFVAAALASKSGLARAAPVEPLAPPSPPPSAVGSLTYVTGPDHLAALTIDDDPLHKRALAVASKVKVGMGVLMGSAVVGALIIVGAATVFQQTECTMPSAPPGFTLPVSSICQSQTNGLLAAGGALTMVIGGATGLALMPAQTEWYDIINQWNARHPERTLLVAPSHHDD
jgi:hypothetical protein